MAFLRRAAQPLAAARRTGDEASSRAGNPAFTPPATRQGPLAARAAGNPARNTATTAAKVTAKAAARTTASLSGRWLRGALAALGLGGGLLLAACAPKPPAAEVTMSPARFAQMPPMPPMLRFGPTVPLPVTRDNADLARDFLDLAFRMESGRALPRLARFEGPVTLYVTGTVPPSAKADITTLTARLQREAGMRLRTVYGPPPATGNAVTIEFLPRAQMQELVPDAACFVVPRISSWEEYRKFGRTEAMDWATLDKRTRAAVFIPGDTAPQEIRDCLHEETAQAIGPLNDLYRLPDSVFNDDNFHSILTGTDMLMVRIFNSPELKNGMTRAQVAARLPKILNRLHPSGGNAHISTADAMTPRPWINAVETALGPDKSDRARLRAAHKAVDIATKAQWNDVRTGFSWFMLARLSLPNDIETAFTGFLRSALIFRSQPGMELQAAFVDMQLGAFALSAGEPQDVLIFLDRSIPVARRAENAALLSNMLFLRAQALELMGRTAEARANRREAMGWGLYGFGSAEEVWRRMNEIEALSPASRPQAALLTAAAD